MERFDRVEARLQDEEEIGTRTGRIRTLEDKLDTLNGRIGTLEEEIDTLKGQISKLQRIAITQQRSIGTFRQEWRVETFSRKPEDQKPG